MSKQLCIYFDEILSKFQRFQYLTLSPLDAFDDKNIFGALITDLLKAFDGISHDLLIVKLNAYATCLETAAQLPSKLQAENKN